MKWIALAALVILAPAPAFGQGACVPRDKALKLLEGKYKEKTVALGVTSAGGLVEVLVGREKDTWTIMITTPQGVSCLVAAGDGWRTLKGDLVEGPET